MNSEKWEDADLDRPPSIADKGEWKTFDGAGEEGDEMVIYDPENPDSWVQSDLTWEDVGDDGLR